MKLIKSMLVFLFIFTILIPKALSMNRTCLYLFYGATCPHCAEERPFLEQLKEKYPDLEVHEFEVYYNETNREFWSKICNKYKTEPLGVPMTFIGDMVFIGFTYGDNKVYDERFKAYVGYSGFIEEVIRKYIRSGGIDCPDKLKVINVTHVETSSNVTGSYRSTLSQRTYNVYLYAILFSLAFIGIFIAKKFRVRIKIGGGDKK